MFVRFGYVAMSVHWPDVSPSRTMTYTRFSAIPDREAALRKLERIAADNLRSTLRLLRHNLSEGIRVYRFSSRLVPLMTHEALGEWDALASLEDDFAAVGAFVREHGMRVSFHPDHFTVLSTPRADVLDKSVLDLDRHVAMFEKMGLDERYKCNIHIGGTYGAKTKTFERFLRQFEALPERIRRRITLENDDKTFTARETLEACKALGAPMVLDIHHHAVNHDGEAVEDLWEDILKTWPAHASDSPDPLLVPKIHLSSPRSASEPRSHADYVDADAFLEFARKVAPMTPRLDVMIEAKRKDDALLRLLEDLSGRDGVRRPDEREAALEIG